MDALSRATQLLPGWVPWAGPAVYMVLVALFTAFWLRLWALLLLRPLRCEEARAAAAGERLHWTARARLSFAARHGFLVIGLGLVCCAVPMTLFWIGPLSRASSVWMLPLVALLTQLGVMQVYRRRVLPQALGRQPAISELVSGVVVLLLLQPLLLLLIAMRCSPERLFSWQAALWAVVTSLGILASHYGWSLRLLGRKGISTCDFCEPAE